MTLTLFGVLATHLYVAVAVVFDVDVDAVVGMLKTCYFGYVIFPLKSPTNY